MTDWRFDNYFGANEFTNMKIKPVDNVYFGAHLPPKQQETKEMNMNEVIKILQKWQLEAASGHNDGWTQKYYRDKIKEVKDYLED